MSDDDLLSIDEALTLLGLPPVELLPDHIRPQLVSIAIVGEGRGEPMFRREDVEQINLFEISTEREGDADRYVNS